ncbi:hypothetical protein [Novosphingobium aquae]|uniref:Secreted protein n=1 Tax=Novosphingobium aquae TaxID=3133435 RepID=A0ABU8S4X2_9SPHN
MKAAFRTAAGLAALISTTAQAAEPACFTRAEVNSLIAYALPVVMDPMIASCRPHLASDAYLLSGGQRISEVLAARKDTEWKAAKAAVMRVWGGSKELDMPDNVLQASLNEKVTKELAGKLKASECKDISAIAAKLSPLSPDQLVDLAGEIIVVAVRDRKSKAGAMICQAN